MRAQCPAVAGPGPPEGGHYVRGSTCYRLQPAMSHPLLMALFRDLSSAAAAARGAHALGVDRADLSVVARDHQDEERIATQIEGSPGSEIEDSSTASRLGELSGYILAAIAIGLPGTGAVVAAGPLAA